MEELDFVKLANQELRYIQDALDAASYENISDIDMLGDILYIKLTNSSEYVLNKQHKFRELWLSSPISGGHHFKYHSDIKSWITSKDIELRSLLVRELGAKL